MSQRRDENKVAVITGGGSGLGRDMELAFAREGAGVALVDRDGNGAAGTGSEIAKLARPCCVIAIDLTAPDAPRQMVARAVAELGRLDVLVNNAAVWAVEPFLEITEESWDRLFAINVRAL